MLHTQMIDSFIKLNLKEGDLVRLILSDNTHMRGKLDSNTISCKETPTGEKLRSRIEILVPPSRSCMIAEIPVPVYVEDIAEIIKEYPTSVNIELRK
jgi:hypothetical protein